jgi:hypothetical protein
MKKRITTLLLGLGACAFIHAQVLFDNDTKKSIDFTSGGWNATRTVVVNPVKSGLNTTDSVMQIVTTADNWGQSNFTFDSVLVGANNAIELLVLTTTDSADMKLGDGSLNSGAFNLGSGPENLAVEKDTWYKWTLTVTGATAGTWIKQLQIRFTGINPNTPTTLYIDEIKLTNYVPVIIYNPPRLTMDAVYTATPMVIDGDASEDAYNNAIWQDIAEDNITTGSLPASTMGAWTALWDNTYLYLELEFASKGEDLMLWDNTNFKGAWSGDGFQLYGDIVDRRSDARLFGNFSGIQLAPGTETSAASSSSNWYKNQFTAAMQADTNLLKMGTVILGQDFTIELAIPWLGLCDAAGVVDIPDKNAYVADEIKIGKRIAWDVQMNISKIVDDWTRQGMKSWCSTPKEPYGNSGTWGAILLNGTTVGTTTITTSNEVSVFPNPTTGLVTFNNLPGAASVDILDLAGKVVLTADVTNSNIIDMSQLTSGIYIARVGKDFVKIVKK